jgi:hypothetical protein
MRARRVELSLGAALRRAEIWGGYDMMIKQTQQCESIVMNKNHCTLLIAMRN